jgi:putative component of toxin-antitoxin plasmid stabilization module
MVRGSSLLLREATAIRIDLAQLGFPYHMTYAGLGLDPDPAWTYIYQPVPRSLKTWTILRYLGAQYPLHCIVRPWRIRRSVLHGTPTISIRPVHSCLFKLRINRGKGLPEYVASTGKVLTTHMPTMNGLQSTQVERARPSEPVSTYHDNQFRPVSY